MADLNFLTDEQVVLLQELLDERRARRTESYHEADERLNNDQDSNNHIVLTPLNGIPAMQGSLMGHATCSVYEPIETSYRSGECQLVPVKEPGGGPYTLEVYNPSDEPVEYGFYNVDRERYGVWAVHFSKGTLVLVEAAECLKPNDVNKAAYLHRLQPTGWAKTNTVIKLSDRIDGNMLVPGDKVFAIPVGNDRYDIVGSHGLHRWGKPTAKIECNTNGKVTIYKRKVVSGNNGDCRNGEWRTVCVPHSNGQTGTWTLAQGCDPPCTPGQIEEIVGLPCVPGRADIVYPCEDPEASPHDPPPEDPNAHCALKSTGCEVDVCNSIPPNRCYKEDEFLRIDYLGGGVWDIVPFKRNSLYTAILGSDMCGLTAGSVVDVDEAQPLEFCMTSEELDSITSVKNTYNHQGMQGDKILILEDISKCDGDKHIINVVKKCRYIPVDGACSMADPQEKVFLRQKEDECKIEAQMLRMAIETCAAPTWNEQISLTEFEALYDAELQKDFPCKVILDGVTTKFCGFPSPNGPGRLVDLGSASFPTKKVVGSDDLRLYLTQYGTGTGSDVYCTSPQMVLAGKEFDAMICEEPYPEPQSGALATLPLRVQDAFVEKTQAANGCPGLIPESFIVFAFCETGDAEYWTCNPCPTGTGTGS